MFSNNENDKTVSKDSLNPATSPNNMVPIVPIVPKPDPDAPALSLAERLAAAPPVMRSPLPRRPQSPPRPLMSWAQCPGLQTEPAGRKRPFNSTQDGQPPPQQQQPAKKQATPTPSIPPPRVPSPPRGGGRSSSLPRNMGQGYGGGNNPPRKRRRGRNRQGGPPALGRTAGPIPVRVPDLTAPPIPLNNPFALVGSSLSAANMEPDHENTVPLYAPTYSTFEAAPLYNPFLASSTPTTSYSPASTALSFQQQQPAQQLQLQLPQQQPQREEHIHYHQYFIYNNMQMTLADARGVGPHGRGGVVQVSGLPANGFVREITDVAMLDEGVNGMGAETDKDWESTSA